jgi:hypothetical protein
VLAAVGKTSCLQAAHTRITVHADTDDEHRLTRDCYFWLEAATNPNGASERVAFGMRAQPTCYRDSTNKTDR